MATSTLNKQQDARVGADDEDCESYDKLGFMTEGRNLGAVDIKSDDYWTPLNLPPNLLDYKQMIKYLIDKMGHFV